MNPKEKAYRVGPFTKRERKILFSLSSHCCARCVLRLLMAQGDLSFPLPSKAPRVLFSLLFLFLLALCFAPARAFVQELSQCGAAYHDVEAMVCASLPTPFLLSKYPVYYFHSSPPSFWPARVVVGLNMRC